MTPAARLQARIEVLDLIDAGNAPADRVLGAYTRSRRYIGSKDRRAIADGVYGVLRRRAKLTWWCGRGTDGRLGGSARALTVAALALLDGQGPEQIQAWFDGSAYHPAPLDPEEASLARALRGQSLEHPGQDLATRLELPAWLVPRLVESLGPDLETEIAASNRAAPLDLRVNTLKATREAAHAALAAEGIEAAPIELSPIGLRVAGRRAVTGSRAFRDGLVEVQDAGSQVAALLSGARPGMAVADFCAGAGGKTLALAAAMENRGRLVALEVEQARLDRAAARLRRAGASLAERRVLAGGGPDGGDPGGGDPGGGWLAAQGGQFDRVLVDAPCSGSGAWRRDPHARWQLDPERLALYRAAQADSLDRAAGLVRPGGRLVYVTCSLLAEENGVQAESFLARHGDFTARSAARTWRETLGALGVDPPARSAFRGDWLQLTPARHGTDGFFVAILERGPSL